MQSEQHYIEIENFSTIKHCRIDLRRFNVLIGPQASGKSVIAKLLFFFREFPCSYFREAVIKNMSMQQIDQLLIKRFERIFPRYTWEKKQFSILFYSGNYRIRLLNERENSDRCRLTLDYSESITSLYYKLKDGYNQELQALRNKLQSNTPGQTLEFTAYRSAEIACLDGFSAFISANSPVFIPASRSFFAQLQQNTFLILEEKIAIDPLLQHLGVLHSSLRNTYADDITSHSELVVPDELILLNKMILCGEYSISQDKDWITSDHGKILLANASSGQQEALPMLTVLSTIPFYFPNDSRVFFIEEPEAHLFPFAQKSIVALLSLIYANTDHEITLTTHSPYILSAMNVLITAHDYAQNHGVDKAREIIGDAMPIAFEDVAAYTVEKGTARSIMDPETRLVGESIIDAVSDSFAAEFDRLLEDE